MDTTSEYEQEHEQEPESAAAPIVESVAPARRQSLRAEHLEPWKHNVVDLTLTNGSHRVGLLKQIEKGNVHLQAARGSAALPDGGIIRIVDTISIKRAALR
jgi:hypothetical protein